MPPVTPQQPERPSQPVPHGDQPPSQLPAGFGAGIAQAQAHQVDQQLQTTESKYKRTKVLWYVTIAVAAILLIATIFFSVSLGSAKLANKNQYDNGYKAGDDARKKQDADDAIKASLADTRTYQSSDELGSFTLAIPKSFSISTSKSGKDQLILLAHPDTVDTQSKYLAFRLTVRDELFAKVRDPYDRDAKSRQNGMNGPEDLQVDGRTAVRYTGNLDRRDKVGTLILVQVRDKTIMLQTDNNDDATLLAAFNSIVSSTKLP